MSGSQGGSVGARALGLRLRRDPARLLTLSILVGGGVACLALNLPGHFSYDSVVQLAEGRRGVYAGAHPPVMSWLLGLADAAMPGAAPFVVFDVLLIFGALTALALIAPRTSWLAPPLAALIVPLPQLIVYPAIVWKDVLFAGAMTGGFAALAWAAAHWTARPLRGLALAKALALLVLAALARQNGAIVLPVAALAVGWIAVRSGEPRRRGLVWGAGFLAAGAVLTAAGAAALATRLDGAQALGHSWESLETYDIVAAAARDPRVELAILHAHAPAVETLIRTEGVADYTPDSSDSLAPLQTQIDRRTDAPALIFAQWRGLVLGRPWLYLRVRASAFGWVAMTPSPDDCVMVETGVEGPTGALTAARLQPRKDDRDDALGDYALAFSDTPIYRHGAYAALGALLLIPLLRRRTGPDLAVAAMLVSALAFAASFFVISIACDYRYLYALDVATIAAALYAAASFRWRGSAKQVADPVDPAARRPSPGADRYGGMTIGGGGGGGGDGIGADEQT